MTTATSHSPAEQAARIRSIDDYRIRDSQSESWLAVSDSVLLLDRVCTDPADREYIIANLSLFAPSTDVIPNLTAADLRRIAEMMADYANLLEPE